MEPTDGTGPPTPITISDGPVTSDPARLYWVLQHTHSIRETSTHLLGCENDGAAVIAELRDQLNALASELPQHLCGTYKDITAEYGFGVPENADLTQVFYHSIRMARWIDSLLSTRGFLAQQADETTALQARNDATSGQSGGNSYL